MSEPATPADDAAASASTASASPPAVGSEPGAADQGPLAPVVDYAATWRRLRRTLSTVGGLVLAGWVVGSIVTGTVSLRLLAELLGFGVFASFAIEVVVVGGAAVRGMLAAGERGDRLSSPDVALFPPQVGRRDG